MTNEQFRDVLARAEEIDMQRALRLEETNETNQLIQAAEEAGLSREAVLTALRERISLTEHPLSEGDLVFAQSADDRHYVAKVLSVEGGILHVQFLNGADSAVDRAKCRPFQAVPGSRMQAQWPGWGWWTCNVIAYDSRNQKVQLSDGWSEQRWFHVSDVRLDLRKEGRGAPRGMQALIYAALMVGGGVIGSLLTWLLTR
ncbi:MAG: hypothetical protein HONBIEJF_01712 [Fimbriimonadaceae bacterium]|nr:hypothetical protein [Fimbriimonadaceae bacterium]